MTGSRTSRELHKYIIYHDQKFYTNPHLLYYKESSELTTVEVFIEHLAEKRALSQRGCNTKKKTNTKQEHKGHRRDDLPPFKISIRRLCVLRKFLRGSMTSLPPAVSTPSQSQLVYACSKFVTFVYGDSLFLERWVLPSLAWATHRIHTHRHHPHNPWLKTTQSKHRRDPNVE